MENVMHRIALVVSPGFQLMSFAALSAFEFANLTAERPAYDVRVLSEDGGPVKSSMGPALDTTPIDDQAYDTVIFGGDLDGSCIDPAVVDYARRVAREARRMASICTGAFVLAQAGLLDDRSATTHWSAARELAARFPRIKVDPDRIFIVDGPIWTSAGASAGVDLALGMIEKDLGPEIARLVARKLVVYHRRPAASRSTRPCWTSTPSPTASRPPSTTLAAT
jgi:transcriptional regulator GlxA family with amidase domain